MRKNLKRILSALLVVVMVLTMLPTVTLAATETYTVTPIAGIPEAGVPFVIYAPSGGVVAGAEATGGKTPGITARSNEENANLRVESGAGVYKLTANTDGTYYLTCGGRYYTATFTSTAEFTTEPTKGSKWKINELGEGWQIANTDYAYQGNPASLEVYNSAFSPYGFNESNASIYTMQFYAIDEATADPDGDGYSGTKPIVSALPADGDTVVIYNEYGGAVFGAESGDTTAPSIQPAFSSKDSAGNLIPGNGGLIFTVEKDGDYYAFKNNGKYLRTSENKSDGGNDECLWLEEGKTDYSLWRLEEVTGGYIMFNKLAKYNRNSVCIEYFSNAFSGWTFNGSTQLFAMNFYKVEDPYGLGYVLNPKVDLTAKDAYRGVDYTFSFVLDELTKVTSLKAEYTVGSGTDATEIEITETKAFHYTASVPKTALEGQNTLRIRVAVENEYGMKYDAVKTVNVIDEPVIVSVSPEANAATGSEKKPTISAVIANCGANPTVEMTINGNAVTPTVTSELVSYVPETSMVDDRHVVALKITRADGKTAEMTWSFFVGEAGLSLYFGQLHSHTAEYSDGAGTLEDAYEHAMQAEDVDFLIVTDHSNYFDKTGTATTSSYYDLSSLTQGDSLSKWEEAKATAAEYNAKSSDFIAAYGYEMTWSGGPGHTNTFNTYGIVSRNNSELNNKTDNAGMFLYNDLMVNANNGLDVDGNAVAEGVKTKYLEDAPVISQFNHPGTTFGNFDDFAGYTPARDAVLNLVEVGNGEGAVGGSSYWPSYSQYDLALAKGWHVAPTNNQDNHKGKWGDSNTCRDVILTDDFTEAGLYKAMAERRVYATEDQNLRIYYYLNDVLMGGVIEGGAEGVQKVHIKASISDPDGENLGKIEIIGENGISLKSYTASGATFELDDTISNTNAYYYLKVTQADGDIAVTAPVWVGEATPITADLETKAALSVSGVSEKLVSSISNGATADYQLNRVRFSVVDADGNSTGIKTFTDSCTVAAGSSQTFTVDFTPTTAGKQTIQVVYYGTYEGENFKCQATLTLDVAEPANLVKIGVDRGHDNYYVSGDYADSVGNFINYCADNSVWVQYVEEGQFTYENLKQYKLLVLTVNYRRNAAKAKDYTDAEIEALKQYVANGGSVILCSKSDRDNLYDNCAANSNKLLEAIGAHTRVVNGIIVDNDLKASEAYRVYFSAKDNFNLDHRFLKGAYTASNAFGTTPSPENQTGFQLYNGAPLEITSASKVEVLVRGYDSTWGSHYDGYFDSNSFVPEYEEGNAATTTVNKGDVNIMTYEDLPGGGWIITSGVTFLSNYDVKNDADYVNKFIVQNILLELTEAESKETLTPIETVKKVPESRSGEEYTIEGYVTSNASAYDQDTAFFDCIYVQDEEGNGINVFPVAGNYAIGMKVRCHGAVTYYCGEVELNLGTDYNGYIRVVSDELATITPKNVNCAVAMADSSIGNLMRVAGIVTDIHKTAGVIDKIYVRDTTGEACLFINGYITKDDTSLDALRVGMTVSGVGIGSRDVDESSADSRIFARLRVRDRADIQIYNSEVDVLAIFTDVSENAWYANAVKYAVQNELLYGMSATTFEPDSELTRAMVATVLYRLAGKPTVSAAAGFDDVASGRWYTDAIAWAELNGIASGYEDNTFRPDEHITRQEMAAMLARYAENVAMMDTTPKGDLEKWSDKNSVAAWAKDDLIWMIDCGIISGMDGRLAPNENATRAQFATIIMLFSKL